MSNFRDSSHKRRSPNTSDGGAERHKDKDKDKDKDKGKEKGHKDGKGKHGKHSHGHVDMVALSSTGALQPGPSSIPMPPSSSPSPSSIDSIGAMAELQGAQGPSRSSPSPLATADPSRMKSISVGLIAGFSTLLVIFVFAAYFYYRHRQSEVDERYPYARRKDPSRYKNKLPSSDIESLRHMTSSHPLPSLPTYSSHVRERTPPEPRRLWMEFIQKEKEKDARIQDWAVTAALRTASIAPSSTVVPANRILAHTGIRSEASGDADLSDFRESQASYTGFNIRDSATSRLPPQSESGNTTSSTGSSAVLIVKPSTARFAPHPRTGLLSEAERSKETKYVTVKKRSKKKKKQRSPPSPSRLVSRWSSSGSSSHKSLRKAGGFPGPSGHYDVFRYSTSEFSSAGLSEAKSDESARLAELRAAYEKLGGGSRNAKLLAPHGFRRR